MLINGKKPTQWGSPTLDRLVALTASLKNPIDPEDVKRILFPQAVFVQAHLRKRQAILKRNQAWRNSHRAFVAATRSYLSHYGQDIREETRQALKRELSPYGYPEDADPVYTKGRTYKNGIECEKSLLRVDTDQRNRLLSKMVTELADYLFPRLNAVAGFPSHKAIYRDIRALIQDAYPSATLIFPNGRKKSIAAEGWDRLGNTSAAIWKRDQKRDQRP